MSNITLDMLTSIIREERSDLTPTAQGVMLANVIRSIHAADKLAAATPTPAKAPKATTQRKAPKAPKPVVKPVDDKPVAATVLNYAGKAMLCEAGTASKGQQKWMTDNSDLSAADIKDLAMVDASNYRALLTGKITVAQYNLLP